MGQRRACRASIAFCATERLKGRRRNSLALPVTVSTRPFRPHITERRVLQRQRMRIISRGRHCIASTSLESGSGCCCRCRSCRFILLLAGGWSGFSRNTASIIIHFTAPITFTSARSIEQPQQPQQQQSVASRWRWRPTQQHQQQPSRISSASTTTTTALVRFDPSRTCRFCCSSSSGRRRGSQQ